MTTTNIPGLGWHRDEYDPRDVPFVPEVSLTTLPSKVDLTPQCPAPYDQGNLGSCTSQAIAAAFRFEAARQGLPDFLPSRLFIYYYERLLEHTVATDSGAAIRDGIKVINRRGVCPEAMWPYDISKFADAPPLQCSIEALQDRAIKYCRVGQDLAMMKACLASGSVFVFGIDVFQSFMDSQDGTIPMPAPDEQLLGGHALLCVGYDDTTQRFIFLNSWGSSWPAQPALKPGFGTIPYAYLAASQHAADFWEIQAVGSTLTLLIDEFKALL
jgi:C1A family cysteine protease